MDSKEEDYSDIKPEWTVFANEYLTDFKQGKAYMKAYPESKENAANVSAHHLLRKPKFKKYLDYLKSDLGRLVGVSAKKIAEEHMKIAFSDMANYKDTWITLKEFDSLTRAQKAAIKEVEHSVRKFEGGQEEIVKIKLHDKQKSLSELAKMIGANEPIKMELSNPDGNMSINVTVIPPEEMD